MTSPPPVRIRLLVVAMVVDSLGSGLFGPFVLLFGHVVVGLSLPTAGAAIALAGLIALGLGPPAGAALDRYGPGRLLVAANVTAAIGDAVLLLAHDRVTFALASLLELCAARVFWAGFSPLVARMVAPEEQERWFGKLRAVRYAGLGVGGALASGVLLLGERRGLQLMVVVDLVSYAAAAGLTFVATRSLGSPQSAAERRASPKGTYRAVLADRGNTALAVLNFLCTLSIVAPLIAMPVYVLDHLDERRWVPGAVAAAATLTLFLAVSVSHRLARGHHRLLVIAVANVLWACASGAFALAAVGGVGGLALLFLAAALLGVAEGTYAPTADIIPITLAPAPLVGRYTAVHQLGWGVSTAVAPLLVGVLLDTGTLLLWSVLAAVAALTGLSYLALRPALDPRVGRSGGTT